MIAYEPVWLLVLVWWRNRSDNNMHCHIHSILDEQFSALKPAQIPSVIYGGSVKKENATLLLRLENVGGALVGGASLSADSFAAIVSCADKVIC